MKRFNSNGVGIAYIDEGGGEPVLLVHGFASTHRINWVDTAWTKTLTAAGFRVIALDNRGHGASDKLYRPEDYRLPLMVGDLVRLLGHLGLASAHVMGYSMGARMTALFAIQHPDRARSIILAGLGGNMTRPVIGAAEIAAALQAPSLDDVPDRLGRMFRAFADQTRSDRAALAACITAVREPVPATSLSQIRCPTLVAVGTDDEIAGPAGALAALIPGAEALDIPNRDHMKAVGDRVYKEGVIAFLGRTATAA